MNATSNTSGSSSPRRGGRVLGTLLRLIFVVVIGALVGLGLYFGVPHLYRSLVLPVRENTTRIAVLEDRLEGQQERASENQRALQDRITGLETSLAQLQGAVATQGRDQQELREEAQGLDQRVDDLRLELESQDGEMAELDATVQALSSDLGAMIGDVDERLERQVEEAEGRMEGLEMEVTALHARNTLLQTAQSLAQVRLLLLEDNHGAARDTLDLAIIRLDQAQVVLPGRADDLELLRERMLALDVLIAERSFRLRPSLEALWNDVMDLAGPPANALADAAEVPADPTDPAAPAPAPEP